ASQRAFCWPVAPQLGQSTTIPLSGEPGAGRDYPHGGRSGKVQPVSPRTVRVGAPHFPQRPTSRQPQLCCLRLFGRLFPATRIASILAGVVLALSPPAAAGA